MAGSLQPRVKTWVSLEDVESDDLNAEFDNCLTAMQPLLIDDYSTNVAQMQVTADPGEVATESLATTLAGELARLRHMIRELSGEDEWYETPVSTLLGLSNAIGTGLTNNRIVSGRVLSTSAQPAFLVPNGAARTVKVDGTPTNFIYYVDGTEYSLTTDVTLTGLTAAPSSNNTALINDTIANDQYWTKYAGEDGSEIPVDAMGTEISALVGKFAAFKLAGVATEYFTAYVESATRLTKARRGYFFDSLDAPIPRTAYTNNDTITLMKLTWIFAKTDGTLTATYNNPVWSDDEPTSPALGDYWFDLSANTWKTYGVGSYSVANAVLIGSCIQDTTNTVAARSFEFFKNYDDLNTLEIIASSDTQVKSRHPGGVISSWGVAIKNDHNIHTWDMTLDLESGVTEAASTYYYFYITETGDKIISDKKPHDRREDLLGYYHPSQSWRCVGWSFNNASSNLEQVESYYRAKQGEVIRSVIATDAILPRDRVIVLSGASFSEHLPPSALCRGSIFTFTHGGTSFNHVYTLDGYASETIGGSTTYSLYTAGETLKILSDGSNFLVLEHFCSTPWIAYTPTFSSGLGTCTAIDFKYRREGDSVRVVGKAINGTVAAAVATIGLPGSSSIDTAKLPAIAQTAILGFMYARISTTNTATPGTTRGPWPVTTQNGVTNAVMLTQGDVDLDADVTGSIFRQVLWNAIANNNESFTVEFLVPVSGWQS